MLFNQSHLESEESQRKIQTILITLAQAFPYVSAPLNIY